MKDTIVQIPPISVAPTPIQSSTTLSIIQSQDKLLDLKVYARLIWHWARLIVLCTVVAGAGPTSLVCLGVGLSGINDIAHRPGADPNASYQDILSSERARTYAELMQRETTMNQVANQFGVDPAILDDVITSITVTPLRDTADQSCRRGGLARVCAAVADTLPRSLSPR
ncbi:MAG: hypothetical protein R2867_16795 [Caldilineaceae bacterium]